MAVKTNVSSFTAATRRFAAAIPVAQRAGVAAAAEATKAGVLAAAQTRGLKPKPSWVSINQRGGNDQPAALVELRGRRAYWAERGTKAHTIKPKRKKAILTPQGPRASAHVKGARAKPFWHEGLKGSQAAAVKADGAAISAALRKAL